jgi:hypothetical protein
VADWPPLERFDDGQGIQRRTGGVGERRAREQRLVALVQIEESDADPQRSPLRG